MIIDKSIGDYVDESMSLFGEEVNLRRQLPYLYDGLKPVYRRVIYTSFDFNKMTKTARLVGECMGKLHPHGDKSIADVVSNLVRYGIFDGVGNHGKKMLRGKDAAPAKMRYSEAMISEKFRLFFQDLLPYVPYMDGELEGSIEPEYLPTPIPLGLLFNGLGIGYGANGRYPMFTLKSMYSALINDDPYQLESPFGMILNKEESELRWVWEKGLGKLTYDYQVEKCGLQTGYGVMISGSPELYCPDLDKAFEEEIYKGQVYFLDQSSGQDTKMFVGRSSGVRSLSLDDIYDTCKKICTHTKTYRLTVSNGTHATIIPLREWLQITYNNYLRLIEVYKEDKIKKYQFDYEVFKNLPVVADCQFKNRNYKADKISEVTGVDLEVVKAILRKSISTLQNAESEAKLKTITDKINEFKNLDGKSYVKSIVDGF